MKIVNQDKLKEMWVSQQPEIEAPKGIEFEPCVKCNDLIETDALDKFGRCLICGDASLLRLVE